MHTLMMLMCILAQDTFDRRTVAYLPAQEAPAAAVDSSHANPPSDDPAAALPVTIEWSTTTANAGQRLRFYTADGWTCQPCDQQKRILQDAKFSFETIGVRFSTDSPTGQVPVWQAPDGTILRGVQSIQSLESFAERHGVSEPETAVTATVDTVPTVNVVAEVLAFHLDGEQPATSSLINIDVDAPETALEIARKLLIDQRWESDSISATWEGGDRTISVGANRLSVTPGVAIVARKSILKVSTKLTGVSYDDDLTFVTLELSGVPDLTIRFR